MIAACFGNTQHWSLMRHLISGNWDYSELGLLHSDNQHLFTRKSFIKTLDASGLKMTEMMRFSYEADPIFKRRHHHQKETLKQLESFL